MGRELTPEEHSLLVEKSLIVKIMGLMSLSEGIESGIAHHLHARRYLLVAPRMAVAEEMFVVARAVDEYGTTVEEELTVVVGW